MPDDRALVQGLVEIPSLSRREGDAVEWLVARMSERGFRASVDDAGNAIGEIGAGTRHVVLLGHIDTVPGEIPVRIEDGDGFARANRAVTVEALAQLDVLSARDLQALSLQHRPLSRGPDGVVAAQVVPGFQLAPIAELA